MAREYLPRFSLHRVEGSFQFFGKGTQRFLGIRQWASGDVDTPSLYAGTSDLLGYTQQKDYYLNGNPLNASQWDANRRNARRLVETSINSNGGGKSHRMVPWLNMSGTDDSDPDNPQNADPDNFVLDYEFREMQMMLRGKNIRECLYYTRGKRPDETVEAYEDLLDLAWTETAAQLARVYAGKITNYVRGTGPMVSPGGGSYPYSTFDTARLEFTLAEPTNLSNQEYEVEVLPRIQLSGGQYKYTTALIVDIEWLNPDYFEQNIADIQIESSVTTDGVLGEIFSWNGSTWVAVESAGAACQYGFYAPQSNDGRYRSRQNFKDGFYYTNLENGKQITRLKLVHTVTKPQSTSVVSRYNLVQMTPVGAVANPGSLMMGPQSDLNTDGAVDTTDWADFAYDWLNSEASADLNLNNAIDQGDVDAFVEAYVSGT